MSGIGPDEAGPHLITLVNRGGRVLPCRADQTIFDACERQGIVLPIACRYGGCITCAARLLSGRVRQPGASALNARQSRAGYILACVARPRGDCRLEVGVESHGELYENPFARAPRSR